VTLQNGLQERPILCHPYAVDQNESSPDGSGPIVRLGSKQQAAVATALTLLAAAIIIASVLGVGWLGTAFLRRFSHVFLPLAVGAIAALVFHPYYGWLHERLRIPAGLAVSLVVVSILIPVVAFSWFFGALAAGQLSEMATKLPEWWEKTTEEATQRWPQVRQFFEENPWGLRLRAMAEGQRDNVMEGLQIFGGKALSAGAGIARGVGALVAWAVLPVYFVFFLMARPKRLLDLDNLLPFFKPETRKDALYLVDEFVNIVVAFFRGQLIIAFLQGVLYAIGFSAIGLRYGFVLGLLLGLLNVIPYLGSMIGLGIGLPLAYFQQGGGLLLTGLVMIVFTVVQLIESYGLTPRIMGDRTGLHPLAIIVAIFFWGSALEGILGMIMAIPLTAFLVVFWRLAREKYIGELV
jgi:predicted PurR-regulated permease PerM